MASFVTIEGYQVRRTTEKAVGLVKEGAGPTDDLIWVPRSCCRDGDILAVDDTQIECMEYMADDKGLDY